MHAPSVKDWERYKEGQKRKWKTSACESCVRRSLSGVSSAGLRSDSLSGVKPDKEHRCRSEIDEPCLVHGDQERFAVDIIRCHGVDAANDIPGNPDETSNDIE